MSDYIEVYEPNMAEVQEGLAYVQKILQQQVYALETKKSNVLQMEIDLRTAWNTIQKAKSLLDEECAEGLTLLDIADICQSVALAN